MSTIRGPFTALLILVILAIGASPVAAAPEGQMT
jgi:hypothetical protein